MSLKELVENEYFLGMLALVAMLYSGLSKPVLPKWISQLFKNDIFRVVFIALIAMIPAKQSPHVAIIIAIIFIMTLNFVFQEETREKITMAENFMSISNDTTIKTTKNVN